MTHISTVDCAEITGDRPGQPAYEIWSIKRKILIVWAPTAYVQGVLRTEASNFGYLFKTHGYFIVRCTLISQVVAPMVSRVTWALLKLLVNILVDTSRRTQIYSNVEN